MSQSQSDLRSDSQSPLSVVARRLVQLHKTHFGRGPTKARAFFAGPDMLACALADALLPAERKMTELGMQEQVRHSRISFQAAVQQEFIAAIEQILDRSVTSFASAVDPDNDMVFEIFCFDPGESPAAAEYDGHAS